MSFDGNPWFVSSLDEFLVYNCPECNEKYESKEPFVLHAFEKHPKAKDCLELRLDSEKVEVVCKKQKEQSVTLKLEEINIADVVFVTSEGENLDIKHGNLGLKHQNLGLKHENLGIEHENLCDASDSETESPTKTETKIGCSICKLLLPNQNKLHSHVFHEHKNHADLTCEICNLMFDITEKKQLHMSIVHDENVNKSSGDTKSNSCDICEKAFPKHADLKIHVQEEHNDHPDLKCEICNVRCVSKFIFTCVF